MDDLLLGIAAEPALREGWLILSDWLEENGRPLEAEFVRLREDLTIHAERNEARKKAEQRLRHLLLKRLKPPCATWTGQLARHVDITFSLVPPGRFLMGSVSSEPHRYDNEGPRHQVTITKPFWMGVVPVTRAQYEAVMGKNPRWSDGPRRPAESVNGHEAEDFCRRASELLGRTVRLPTDAEWEFACRGGTTTMYFTGNGERAMWRAGWCSRKDTGSGRSTRVVGRYLPNPWGLFDMHGNVREWCADDLRLFTRAARTDPRGPESQTSRVVRGGSWYYIAEDSRSASRYNRPMDYRLDYYGFRVMMPA